MNRTHTNYNPSQRSRRSFKPSNQRRKFVEPPTDYTTNVAEASSHSKPPRGVATARPAKRRQSRSMVLSRQALIPKKRRSGFRLSRINSQVIASMLIVVNLAFGGYFLLPQMVKDSPSSTAKFSGNPDVIASNGVLSDSRTYGEALGFPSSLVLEESGAQASVELGGLSTDGQLIHSEEPNTIGWFERSAKPNNPGAVLLFMKQGNQTANNFSSLVLGLKNNDTLTLTLSNQQKIQYSVASTKKIAYDTFDISKTLEVYQKNESGLNILVEPEQPGQDYILLQAVYR